MNALSKTDGPELVLSGMRVLRIRLLSRPDTQDLAPHVTALRDTLKARYDAWTEARDARIAATGSLEFADLLEDQAVADLARSAKVVVRGDLEASFYVSLFVEAPSKVTAGLATSEQSALVEHLLDKLHHDPVYGPLGACLAPLQAAHEGVQACGDAREAAKTAELTAWTALQVAETAARDAYNAMEATLLTRFPRQQALVDTFFLARRRGKKTEEEPK